MPPECHVRVRQDQDEWREGRDKISNHAGEPAAMRWPCARCFTNILSIIMKHLAGRGGVRPQVGEVETQDATMPEVTQLGSKRLQFQAQLLQPLKSLLLLPDPQGQALALLVPGQSFPVPSQHQESPSSGARASDTLGVAGCQFFSFQLSDCLE